MATHSSNLAWKIPWTKEPGRLYIVHGVAKSQTRLNNFTFSVCKEKEKPEGKVVICGVLANS